MIKLPSFPPPKTGRPPIDIDMARAREMVYRDGMTIREAARTLGVNHNTLTYRFRSEPRRRERWDKRWPKSTPVKPERPPSTDPRRCADCGQIKPADQFSVRNRAKGYLSSYCKPCNSRRASDYNKRHPERVRENNRRFCERNPERVKEYNRATNARHRDKRNAYHRERRAQNPVIREEYLQRCREWYAKNRERALQMMKEYNALHRGKSAGDILRKINSLVPTTIVDREEVVSAVLLALYEGEIKIGDINRPTVDKFLNQHLRRTSTASHYGHLSLDAPLRDDSARTLGETLAAHYR